MTSEIVTLGQAGSTVILAAQLSFVIFVLRDEFAFMFQTFSRNYPLGKAPPSRGRSVFLKKEEPYSLDEQCVTVCFRLCLCKHFFTQRLQGGQ